MKKVLIIVSSIVAFFVLIVTFVFVFTGIFGNIDEYKLGDDRISSIKSVVAKRRVTSVSTRIDSRSTIKEIQYKSDYVQEDLSKYVQYLIEKEDFILTKNMYLTENTLMAELRRGSNEEGKIIIITIEYDVDGYKITLEKFKGTLNNY